MFELELQEGFLHFAVIESDYNGPSLKDGKIVTEEFVKELLSFLRDQKKLHKKYAYEVSHYANLFDCCDMIYKRFKLQSSNSNGT